MAREQFVCEPISADSSSVLSGFGLGRWLSPTLRWRQDHEVVAVLRLPQLRAHDSPETYVRSVTNTNLRWCCAAIDRPR